MGKLLKFTLEDHLSECEARYQDLKTRLDNVDDRLYRLELLCLDIKNLVSNSQHKTS